MCGIAGLIGESQQPKISFQLTSSILMLLERRGEDATGLWGTQKGELADKKGPSIIYHKEPTKSSDFVKFSNVWRKVKKFNPNLLLLHARSATPGVGQPSYNKNNHPFVSRDLSLSIIHNGKVPEYNSLRDKFKTFSNCDSEILLRILMSETEPINGFDEVINTEHKKKRLAGIRKIWSLADAAHMAVAVGEFFADGSRHLWLWRNHHRPLWVADMRDTLGQVFFFSEPHIWYDAVKDCQEVKSFLSKKQRLIEVPIEQVWHFEIDPARPIVAGGQYTKFKIKSGGLKSCSEKDIPCDYADESKKKMSPIANLICNLDDDDEPTDKVPKYKGKATSAYPSTSHHGNGSSGGSSASTVSQKSTSTWNAQRGVAVGYGPTSIDRVKRKSSLAPEDPNLKGSLLMEIENTAKKIKDAVDELIVDLTNGVKENSVSADVLTDLINHLDSIHLDIQASKMLMGNA